MPELICDTSPLQYLHQLGLLDILPSLSNGVIVPGAVVNELAQGEALGVDLPSIQSLDWLRVEEPSNNQILPVINDLGPGETAVLMLALAQPESVVILDDALARKVAQSLNVRLSGTLGLLLDAKKSGLISAVEPYLDKLQALDFHLSAHTRAAVLKLAGED